MFQMIEGNNSCQITVVGWEMIFRNEMRVKHRATVLVSDVGLYLPDYAMKDVQILCN